MKLTEKIRWWLLRNLSGLWWWICPEPYKSVLKASMLFDKTMWEDLVSKETRHE